MNSSGLLILTFFFLFGIKVPIVNGIYFHDIMMVLMCVISASKNTLSTNFKSKGFKLKKIVYFLIIFLVFFVISTIDIIDKSDPKIYLVYYIPIKLIMLFLFFYFYDEYFKIEIITTSHLTMISVFIALPVLLSILMHHIPAMESILNLIYKVESYAGLNRFGGVFGSDVNALGMYSSLVLVLSLCLCIYRKYILAVIISVICMYAILISGMRAGLIAIALIVALSVIVPNFRVIPVKYILITFCVIVLVSLFAYSRLDVESQEYIVSRFSLGHLLTDLGGEEGNLFHAIKYLESVTEGYQLSYGSIIFGYDTSLLFVDNLYIFIFVKYGLVGLLIFLGLFVRIFLNSNDRYVKLAVIFSLILSIKGIFIIGNYYYIILFFILFIVSNKKDLHKDAKARLKQEVF